eukprot:7990475-Karenia_brevis.AAC.1
MPVTCILPILRSDEQLQERASFQPKIVEALRAAIDLSLVLAALPLLHQTMLLHQKQIPVQPLLCQAALW